MLSALASGNAVSSGFKSLFYSPFVFFLLFPFLASLPLFSFSFFLVDAV